MMYSPCAQPLNRSSPFPAQATLGSEGLSLQLRHISSYLLWYCGHWKQHQTLAHEIILLLGYFCLSNPENQVRRVLCGQRTRRS